MKLKLTAIALLCFGALSASAQTTLVKNGKATSRILITAEDEASVTAANLLQDFASRISGATLPVANLNGTSVKKGDVVISNGSSDGDDGFTIDNTSGVLNIISGGGRGSVYGVVTILEEYLGVRYWGFEEFDYTKTKDIRLPVIKRSETPAFRYRQTQSYGCKDPIYKLWYRLEEPNEVFIDNLWVHTMNRILPASRFGKEHPEYYSFINGEHRPGTHSQWCLTNPEVFDVVCRQLDSIFAANPQLNLISVSQNDGNDTFCHCPECAAIDSLEGAPSGNIIRFLNKLAARYPDKEFSTLAYLFSMHAPKVTKPLPNVNIMLCDIDCKRELPLTQTASGKDFSKALEDWSRISDNIFVWDYGINFDNTVSPFPNFHILQKNIQQFKEHNVTMHFSQVNGIRGGDFSELRAYMLAKLMWDPHADADSLMTEFTDGYYGAAGKYMRKYLQTMTGALVSSHTPLWIYDSPISHKDGMLCPALIKMYDEYFDAAEAAVESDSTLLARVQRSRMTLQYSKLEIARTDPSSDPVQTLADLELFEQRTARFGVETLNERNNHPADYCRLYRTRFLPREDKSLALGASVEFIQSPEEKYRPIASASLTDGLYGGTTYVESWIGWCGRDAEFIIDLGCEKKISCVSADFLHQLGAWILLPKDVNYEVSADGKEYVQFGEKTVFPEDRSLTVKFVPAEARVSETVNARYIKVKISTLGLCPDWHYGVGYPAWFFLDEVEVH